MFQLPNPNSNPNTFDHSARRSSRNYEYDILTFSLEGQGSLEKYTVLCDPEHKTAFAYTPPKQTISPQQFVEAYAEGDEVEIKESIEGTLVTFFWNPHISEWDICTRNGVGGEYSFVKPVESLLQGDEGRIIVEAKTYRQMVIDSFRIGAMMDGIRLPENVESLNDIPYLHTGILKNCSYTCILQHWQNHLVYSPLSPYTAFLHLISIHRHTITEYGVPTVTEVLEYDPDEIWTTARRAFDTPRTKYIALSSARDLVDGGFLRQEFKQLLSEGEEQEQEDEEPEDQDEDLDSWELNDPASKFHPPAWILVNKETGERIEIENPNYRRAKDLRDMQPNLRYHWLMLKLAGKLDAYQRAFDANKHTFAHFQLEYDQFVKSVHQTYVSYYIMKRKEGGFPKKYFVHAAALHHSVYIPSIQAGSKKIITIDVVREYFGAFSPGKLYYSLTQGCETKDTIRTQPPKESGSEPELTKE